MDLTQFLADPKVSLAGALIVAIVILWTGYQGVLKDYISTLRSQAGIDRVKQPDVPTK